MTVVTKYDIRTPIYHKITGERGIITAIIINDKGHTEYRVATGVATYGILTEMEISLDRVYA